MARIFLVLLFLPLVGFSAPQNSLTSQQVEKYIELSYRAEASLRDFDRELELAEKAGQGSLLQRSEPYKELLALRSLIESMEHELAHQYARYVRAKPLSLTSFVAAFKNSTPETKIPLHDLATAIKDHLKNRATPKELELPKFFRSLSAVLAHQKRHELKITARVEQARRRKKYEQEIQATIQDLGLKEKFSLASTIRPSPGPEGNVSGYTFPINTWALTFDDGPSDKYSLPILENLRQADYKATYFMVAENFPANLAIVRQIQVAGMSLNNHSFTHTNLTKATPEVLAYEITESTRKDEEVFGEAPRFFRCPYGAGLNSPNIRAMIAENKMIHVFWNVDSLDWKDKSPTSILARLQKQMNLEKRGVILMHDIHPQTVEASKLLLDHFNRTQARLVTMPEIVDELNQAP